MPSSKDLKGAVGKAGPVDEPAGDGSCHRHVLTFCNDGEVYGRQVLRLPKYSTDFAVMAGIPRDEQCKN